MYQLLTQAIRPGALTSVLQEQCMGMLHAAAEYTQRRQHVLLTAQHACDWLL
jgi:hypothetical protein